MDHLDFSLRLNCFLFSFGRLSPITFLPSQEQQWTVGPSDEEIVPLYEEMLHPT